MVNKSTDILHLILKHLEEDIQTNKEAVCCGAIGTFEGYKRLVGIIQGLRMAKETITDAIKLMEKGEYD